MSGIGESRTELLNWLNELLQLNYRKVEECGTGAAYCQIMDSIYGDIPMPRVKFTATAEYEYQTNYKILQSCFQRHRIEKTVYVDKLIKCKFQDNLEFLQWIKKFWVQNKDESPYDAQARRKYRPPTGNGSTTGSTPGVVKRKTSTVTGSNLSSNTYNSNYSSSGNLRDNSIRSASYGGVRKASNEQLLALQAELSQSHSKVTSLNKEITTYREAMDIMERERDFYFGKLRDIEILVQSTQDLIKEGVYNTTTGSDTNELNKFLGKVQHILYATEEGFEVNNVQHDSNGQHTKELNIRNTHVINEDISNKTSITSQPTDNLIIDEETF
ncbi:hypothetical protein Kpol_401p2 [Vanderwaltozyma polyspora DSM 70294]|uniref:Protein BIM1 n=1 Tax=Vanderwaltozyma polyspora (strain ATCC 22028 / DSM 70294 / BCRC 21397 / CBS 2163 / NBRC 10782 / NRRL Y-8283 / UCD 57-17) TaxID=436907 RepID=A7TRA1_VANPO|nr:uncharacterized protein Kpol_401p2 [Vanderwaltozyma polyspora DSM 70294]EDO15197.1 hypothetical protein Kpol_401p2 [Vanderwaltozyma polyspora DSM 70294]